MENFITTKGQLLRKTDGSSYFIYGKSRIKISEHFAEQGNSFNEIIEEVIRHTANHNVS